MTGFKNDEEEEKPAKERLTDLIFLGLEGGGDKSQILNDFLGVFSFSCSGFTTGTSEKQPVKGQRHLLRAFNNNTLAYLSAPAGIANYKSDGLILSSKYGPEKSTITAQARCFHDRAADKHTCSLQVVKGTNKRRNLRAEDGLVLSI